MFQKIGRDDPCPCYSGLKFDRCCGKTAVFNTDGFTYRGRISLTDENAPEVGTREGAIIVKVQTPLNDSSLPALIYDRERTFERLVDLEQVRERMMGRVKAFFYARLSFGQFVLEDEAPPQAW